MVSSEVDIPLSNSARRFGVVVGVNGVGKTTTIGKLASQFKEGGLKVLIGAADTFRAAAVDQILMWGKKVGVEVVCQ